MSADTPLAALHEAFLAILPRIETHGRVCFRHLACLDRRADAVAETVALAWASYRRLALRGKDPRAFVSVLAAFAARRVLCGRRLCGQEPLGEALSPRAQRHHGFAVRELATADLGDALRDNTATPPPDQAAFRVDVPAWLLTLGPRDRRIAAEMMRGERTGELAERFGLTAGRVSQLRARFLIDWRRFHGEAADA